MRRSIYLLLLSALLLAGLANPTLAQSPDSTHSETPDRHSRTILEDQALAVLQQGEPMPPELLERLAAPAPSQPSSASRQLDEALQALQQAIEEPDKTASSTRLATAWATFEAHDLLLRDDFERAAERLQALGVGADMLLRLEDEKARYLADSDRLHRLLGSPAKADQAAWQDAAELLATQTAERYPILRSSSLPYRRQSLVPRQPQTDGGVVPSYLSATEVAPLAADLAPTIEASLDAAIVEQAEALGYEPVAIFDFVRRQIDTEWYAGSQKGALGTLRQGRGNDVDKASLLIALLRASSFPCRYVEGTVELPLAYFEDALGLTEALQVGDFLARAGLARSPVVRGGAIVAYAVEHTWISAYLPYTNYRGAVVDFSGKTWVPLDPALLTYTRREASGVLDAMDFDADQFVLQSLTSLQVEEPLARLRTTIADFLVLQGDGATYEEQLAERSLTTPQLTILPSTLPVQVLSVQTEGAALSAASRVSLRLIAYADSSVGGTPLLEHELPLASLGGRRLTLSYAPATADDHRTINAWGGLHEVPAYLIHLRPQIQLGGRQLAVGSSDLGMGRRHAWQLELRGPFGSQIVEHQVLSGSYHALAVGTPGVGSPLTDVAADDSEPLGARLLEQIASGYGQRWDAAESELAALMGVSVARPIPSLQLASNALRADLVLGVPHRLRWQGVTLDASLRIAEPLVLDSGLARDWMRLSALQGSALEHQIFEDTFGVASISADKGLALARQQGLTVLSLDANNVDIELPGLQHPPAIKRQVEDWARADFTVDIPRQEIALEDWRGSVWRVEDPSSGAAGYFLSGGLAGGATAEAPESWVLQFLVDALARLGEEPNDDPMAGATVRKIASSDQQVAPVGERFAVPLAVKVTDEEGRPVQGAEVSFQSWIGGGQLEETTTGAGGDLLTVATNSAGVARVSLRAGTETAQAPRLLLLQEDDLYPTRVLAHQVLVTVDSYVGILTPRSAFEAIALPGEATSLRRTDTSLDFFPDSLVSMLSDEMVLRVEDAYGNPVANAEVAAKALDMGFGEWLPHCGESGEGSENLLFINARRDNSGDLPDCDDRFPTRDQCGESELRLRTDFDGEAVVGVILGNSPYVRFNAEVSVRQVDLELLLQNESVDPVLIPDLEPPEEEQPSPVTYDLNITNHGPSNAESVRVDLDFDNLPAGVTIAEVLPQTGSWQSPQWIVGPLSSGQSALLTVRLEVDPSTAVSSEVIQWSASATAPNDPVINAGNDGLLVTTSVWSASATAPNDPVINAGNDGLLVTTSVAVETSDSLTDPSDAPSKATVTPTIDSVSLDKATAIAPLSFQYGVRNNIFTATNSCSILIGGLVRTVGFFRGSAAKIGEPYGTPIEVSYFGLSADQCTSAESHKCPPGDTACQDACLTFKRDGVYVGCPYCAGNNSPCEYIGYRAVCDASTSTYQRSLIDLDHFDVSVSDDGLASPPFTDDSFVVQADDGQTLTVALSASTQLTAGPTPIEHEVTLEARTSPRFLQANGNTGELYVGWGGEQGFNPLRPRFFDESDDLGSFYAVDLTLDEISPAIAELNDDGVLAEELTIRYRIEPEDYIANLATVQILADGEHVVDVVGTARQGSGEAQIPRGVRLDPEQNHTVRAVLNAGSTNEVLSDEMALPLEQHIFISHSDPFLVSMDTDVALQYYCAATSSFEFELSRAATVTLSMQRITPQGGDPEEPVLLIDGIDYETGSHALEVSLDDLPPGDYMATLKGEDSDGEVDTRNFLTLAQHAVSDQQRVGHLTDQGVNLWRGHLTLNRVDFEVEDRGQSLAMRRSYSTSASKVAGVLGWGWSFNWGSQIEITPCGAVVVTGGEGSGMRFVDDGNGGLKPQPGSHGKLMANGEDSSFDFYTLSGNRYHYDFVSDRYWRLGKVEDTNGNVTLLTWSGDSADRSLLRRVQGASGRSLDFTYESRNFDLWEGDVLVAVQGPGGLNVRYDYDAKGNLISALRQAGRSGERYQYSVFGSWDFEVRGLLSSTLDALNGGRTDYTYEVGEVLAVDDERIRIPFVSTIRRPEGGTRRYVWDFPSLRNRDGQVENQVINSRGGITRYLFNSYGNPLSITDPVGNVDQLEWDPVHQAPTQITDDRGATNVTSHDAFGNPISSTINVVDYDGTEHTYTETTIYTVIGEFIRNRPTSTTDRNGATTDSEWDDQGNLIRQSRLVHDARGEPTTLTTSSTYASNGDQLTSTDPRGGVTTYGYDPHGYLTRVTDPLGHTTTTRYNERGLITEIIDSLGRSTRLHYDDLDRVIRRELPDSGIETTDYFDISRLKVDIDALGRTTRTTSDREGRIILIENAAGGQKVFEYDGDGNKILESTWFDGETPRDDRRFEYDLANRLEVRRDPLGKVTTLTYDPADNIIREVLSSSIPDDDFVPRISEKSYDDLNRVIEMRRQLDGAYVVESMRYDGEGNQVLTIDGLGRATAFQYDESNRLIQSVQPEGRTSRLFYDGSGNIVRRELDLVVEGQPALQVRSAVFDAGNRLLQSTDAEGHSQFFEYDEVSNVRRQIDRRGHVILNEYDARNRQTRRAVITDTSVLDFRSTYDLVGNLKSESSPNGNLITHQYDVLNRRTLSQDTLEDLTFNAYDARGRLKQSRDANGYLTTMIYDGLDRMTQRTLPENRVETFEYDVAGNRIAEVDPELGRTTFIYDSLDRPTNGTDALGATSTTFYDAVGNVIQQIDRLDRVTDLEYDGLDRLMRQLDPVLLNGERYEQNWAYDPAGNTIQQIDRRGIVTEYRYDSENRRTHTTRAGLLLSQFEYDPEGNVVRQWDANRNETLFEYDERNLLLVERRPLGAVLTNTFDAMGDRLSVTDGEGYVRSWTYDLRQRPLTETRGVDETTSFTYDSVGNRLTMRHPLGNEWVYTYDEAHRLLDVTNPLDEVTHFTYDGNNNLDDQTDAKGNLTDFTYDALNRRTVITAADNTVSTMTFDSEGQPLTEVDGNGQQTRYVHDAMGRNTERTYRESPTTPDAAETVISTWDANNNLLTTVETTRSDPTVATTTHTYDAFDRLETITDRWGKRLSYTYDANGNRSRLEDPQGATTQYLYDALNRVSSVIVQGSGSTTYSYLSNGLLEEIQYPNGTSASYEYDTASRVTRIANRHNDLAEVSTFGYIYDANGNRIEQTEGHGGQAVETTTYTFDDADRLFTVAYPEKTTTYTYDDAGNRETEEEVDSSNQLLSQKVFGYDTRNRLLTVDNSVDPAASVTYTYDANGNQTGRQIADGSTTSFDFDLRDRLVEVQSGGTSLGQYTYNDRGLRVQKDTVASGEEQYTYDQLSVLLRTDNSGETTKYDYGPNRLLSVTSTGSGRAYYLFDALGSITDLTTPQGTVQARYKWDAWGNPRETLETEANPFGFTGHEHDTETGLIYAKARFYDPETGRFLSEDPVFGDVNNPPSLHRYLYGFQNPTVYVDPDGRRSRSSTIKIAIDLEGYFELIARREALERLKEPVQASFEKASRDFDSFRDEGEAKEALLALHKLKKQIQELDIRIAYSEIFFQETLMAVEDVEGPEAKRLAMFHLLRKDLTVARANKISGELAATFFDNKFRLDEVGQKLYDIGELKESVEFLEKKLFFEIEMIGGAMLAGELALASKLSAETRAIIQETDEALKGARARSALQRADGFAEIHIEPLPSSTAPRGGASSGRTLWTSWSNYEKVTVNGQEYAKVGDRLFTRHAVDRMQPSGLRGTTAGSGGMPQIRQVGGGYDYGRGVAPQFVEDAVTSSKGVVQPNGNISHTSGSLQVILNPEGAVVTIITH